MKGYWTIFMLAMAMTAGIAPAEGARVTPLGKDLTVRGDASTLAYARADGPVHVLSSQAGRWVRRRVAVPQGCVFSAAGSGRVIFDCNQKSAGGVTPWFYDVASATLGEVPGGDALADYEDAHYPNMSGAVSSAVGSRLLATQIEEEHGGVVLLFESSTGRIFEQHQSRRTVPSLDAPSGEATLCKPLVRPTVADDTPGPPLLVPADVAYAVPYMAYSREEGSASRQGVFLEKCGSQRTITLSHQPGSLVLTRRLVAWMGRRLHVRSLTKGRTAIVRTPASCRALIGGSRYLICSSGPGRGSAWLIDLSR